MAVDFRSLAQVPLKQLPNRVWRTYQGGAMIDQWRGDDPPEDGSFPEEWIMSTVTARGIDRLTNEGLSMVQTSAGTFSLKEIIAADPERFLGKSLAEKYGTTGVLIKLLDSNERLTIQVHPDKKYAKEVLHSAFGKTESWYVLGTRDRPDEKSAVYMGFKEHVTRALWQELFEEQNKEEMLSCLHRIEIEAGDAFMVYGGVPHAIGEGCFLLEVQEPTDYTMRVERTTPAGLKIDDALIHQEVGIEKMLECFHYDPCSIEEAREKWKISPSIIEQTNTAQLRSIFNEHHTNCFAVSELELHGDYTMRGNGGFFVGVIYQGTGSMFCHDQEYPFSQGDEIFFSAAIEEITFNAEDARILLCYPPTV